MAPPGDTVATDVKSEAHAPKALDVEQFGKLFDQLTDRDGEADVFGVAANGGVDADQLSQDVEQRSSRIARIDAGVRLDEIVKCDASFDVDVSAGGADDPAGDGVIEAERVADSDDDGPASRQG